MDDLENAAARAAAKAQQKAQTPATKSFLAKVERALDGILAALEAGSTMAEIAAEAGVPAAKLSWAVTRATRRRAGLTLNGTVAKTKAGSSRPINAPGAAAVFDQPAEQPKLSAYEQAQSGTHRPTSDPTAQAPISAPKGAVKSTRYIIGRAAEAIAAGNPQNLQTDADRRRHAQAVEQLAAEERRLQGK